MDPQHGRWPRITTHAPRAELGLRLARARTGEPLPAATPGGPWGRVEPRDKPCSRRVRYLVLRNESDGPGRWQQESRDGVAGWRRAFGDGATAPPPPAAVIIAANADNQGVRSIAHVTGLNLEP